MTDLPLPVALRWVSVYGDRGPTEIEPVDDYYTRDQLQDYALDMVIAKTAELQAENARLRTDAANRDSLCLLLAGSWMYGNWRAETQCEHEQERLMRALGWWPITEAELVSRTTISAAASSMQSAARSEG